MLRDAIQHLQDTLASSTGELITYTRGDDSWTMLAVQGQYRSNEPGGVSTVHVNVTDWIIRKTDWTNSGANGVPKRGDTIFRDGQTFKVAPVDTEGEWRYTSQHGIAFRVHSQRII